MLKAASKSHVKVDSFGDLIETLPKHESLTGVFLERITDPHNLGAILRSCFYFGVDFVIVDHFSRCPLTATVSRTSAGALELMEVFSTANPVQFLSDARKQDWDILAAIADKADVSTKEQHSSSESSVQSGQKEDSSHPKKVGKADRRSRLYVLDQKAPGCPKMSRIYERGQFQLQRLPQEPSFQIL